ncbi:MAG: DUF2339 domain-containing protein [Flavobacteriales bacterium]|jgi:uncharacterized membrane protein
MTDKDDRIKHLLEKLELLLKRQEDFSREINDLRTEIHRLRTYENNQSKQKDHVDADRPIESADFEFKEEAFTDTSKTTHDRTQQEQQEPNFIRGNNVVRGRSNLERFIGENLINKIGIAITVIGVAIGAKYSIENNLISPLTRIILGYLFGLTLFGFGIRLKAKYENYSAVLVSGAMAIMYFMTYTAYSLYDLIPQILAFVLMLIFTVFTVIAALNYNRQVIAHIGLVGAYAVPFLLSDGSGKAVVLFSYILIINIGILVIAFKRYWKVLHYAAFGFTWLIFLSWHIVDYKMSEDFVLSLVFSSIFFVIFYITFLAYKVLRREEFLVDDVVLLLLNSFLFYAYGYGILDDHHIGKYLLGLFTLLNALVHFLISVIIYRQRLSDKNIHYLVTGLVLVFLTILFPVQFNGNWVTLLWTGEATLLFWIGRMKSIPFYERISYPLMFMAFFSFIGDWNYVYGAYDPMDPSTGIATLFNIYFLTSILFIAAFGFINVLVYKKPLPEHLQSEKLIQKVISFSIPAILIFAIYYTFRMEIASYWNQLYIDSMIEVKSTESEYPNIYWNYDFKWFEKVWLLNYSLLFVSILTFINHYKLKNQRLGFVNLGISLISLLVFLTQGLYVLSELRESYMEQTLAQFYHKGAVNLWIRYLSFSFVALALYAIYDYIKRNYSQRFVKRMFELILHTSTLWIASSEIIHWADIFKSEQAYKLGLSILWGVYSLFLISFGIWKKNQPLRIGAIVLFGVTLVKLFFYDISHLNTISKTIVFVALGVLLLVISYLYHRFKHLISHYEADH